MEHGAIQTNPTRNRKERRALAANPANTEVSHEPLRLVSQPQLAELTGIPGRTWEDWRQRRKGPPFIRCNRLVRYDIAAVNRWLASRTVETNETAAAQLGGISMGREKSSNAGGRIVTVHPTLQGLVEALAEKLDLNRILAEPSEPETLQPSEFEHRDAQK